MLQILHEGYRKNTSQNRGGASDMYQRLLKIWHSYRANYHEILIDDCLDETLRKTLINKLNYHKQKLNEMHQLSPYQ
jgi:hypothetical protein